MNIDDHSIFKNNISTLRECSKEKHDGIICYMTESPVEAINFDGVKDDYIRPLHLTIHPKSSDAFMLLKNNNGAFIEFKSGKIKSYEIRQKILDSVLMLTDIINKGISYTRKNIDFYLVYDETKNMEDEDKSTSSVQVSKSRTAIGETIYEMANSHFIRFDLERFQGYCFKNVFTISKDDFELRCIKALG